MLSPCGVLLVLSDSHCCPAFGDFLLLEGLEELLRSATSCEAELLVEHSYRPGAVRNVSVSVVLERLTIIIPCSLFRCVRPWEPTCELPCPSLRKPPLATGWKRVPLASAAALRALQGLEAASCIVQLTKRKCAQQCG